MEENTLMEVSKSIVLSMVSEWKRPFQAHRNRMALLNE
jgi:hypothetical protein